MNQSITSPPLKTRILTNKVRYWLTQTRISTTALVTAAAGFILSCLLLWLIAHHYQQQQASLIDAYGDALNQLATNQLKVSMSNNNLIGLQSILNDLIDQTNAINAIVYGVDNKIIVQAGEVNSADTFKAYTSPITIDDALLGSLTINIDDNIDSSYWLVIALLAVLATLLLLLLRMLHTSARGPATKDHAVKKNVSPNSISTTNETNLSTDPTSTQVEPQHQALLLLDFNTLDKLYKQLNADARNIEFEKLTLATQKILTLYSGVIIAASASTILIRFENKDQKDCVFNALCCAYLLKQAALKQQWLIGFSSHVYDNVDKVTITDLSQLRHLCHQNSNRDSSEIFIKQKTISEHQLDNRFTLSISPESEYSYVTGLSGNYENLIKNQLSYIL